MADKLVAKHTLPTLQCVTQALHRLSCLHIDYITCQYGRYNFQWPFSFPHRLVLRLPSIPYIQFLIHHGVTLLLPHLPVSIDRLGVKTDDGSDCIGVSPYLGSWGTEGTGVHCLPLAQ